MTNETHFDELNEMENQLKLWNQTLQAEALHRSALEQKVTDQISGMGMKLSAALDDIRLQLQNLIDSRARAHSTLSSTKSSSQSTSALKSGNTIFIEDFSQTLGIQSQEAFSNTHLAPPTLKMELENLNPVINNDFAPIEEIQPMESEMQLELPSKENRTHKGGKGTSKAGGRQIAEAEKHVFWALEPLKGKSWADVEEKNDDVTGIATVKKLEEFGYVLTSWDPGESFDVANMDANSQRNFDLGGDTFDGIFEVKATAGIESLREEKNKRLLALPGWNAPKTKDGIGVLIFGNDLMVEVNGYENVLVLQEMKVVDRDLVDVLQQHPKGTVHGNFLHAMVVAMDMMLKKYQENFKLVVLVCIMFSIKLNARLHYGMSSIPVETILWKMQMILEMQNSMKSHLHVVKAETLILTSGKDMLLTSITEGSGLSRMLQNSQTHTCSDNGDPLFLDYKFQLVAANKCVSYCHHGALMDYITDFFTPILSEWQSTYEPLRWMDVTVYPVMFSTMSGKVVRGLGGIPTTGRVLFVSKHMLFGMDAVPLGYMLWIEQKIVEVNALAKALCGQKDDAFFSVNDAAQASRKSSPRVNNEAVQKASAVLQGSEHRRATNTVELRRVRREYKAKKINEVEYVKAIKEEISKVVELQEELDIDVLVHGEPERNDMVEYFGEAAHISNYAKTKALQLKVEKSPSQNAHTCAYILAYFFGQSDMAYRSFILLFGRKQTDSTAISRITFGGDETRPNYLEKGGVKLVGRKGLGPFADSITDSAKAERSSRSPNCNPSSSVSGYTLIVIVGIKDPIQPGVKEAVKTCLDTGSAARIVTGDNINTAKAIARERGILKDGDLAIEWPNFRCLSTEQMKELIPKIQVAAQSSPTDKHILVKTSRNELGKANEENNTRELSGESNTNKSVVGPQVGYKRNAFIGSRKHLVWQAIRASSSAPYYLDDFSDVWESVNYIYCTLSSLDPRGRGSSPGGGIVMSGEWLKNGSKGGVEQSWNWSIEFDLRMKNANDGLKHIRCKSSSLDPRGRGSFQRGSIVMYRANVMYQAGRVTTELLKIEKGDKETGLCRKNEEERGIESVVE